MNMNTPNPPTSSQLGDLSVLGDVIGTRHTFDYGLDGQCVAYGRDRGELGVGPVTLRIDPEAALVRLGKQQNARYFYVLGEKGWRWFYSLGETEAFQPLTYAVVAADSEDT